MSNAREIREALIKIIGAPDASAFTAEVVSSTDTDCTVKLADLEISGVKLFSIGAPGKNTIKPAKGSMVTVLDLSNGKLRDLVLIKVDEPEFMKFDLDGLVLELNAKTGKIDVSSGRVSLKGLFDSLATILTTLKVAVLAPNAPSGTITPDTLTLVNKFKTDFKALLK
ncbi:MAG: hypothetical protein CVT94_13450 [Bacteroidetes bacterium HGW-Bacteroidetes-11]|jgi:hypothetical protein|nr:MAG: hypothetical protein CVT94_13450 [Bacteroidetes bacterium HGW-Bacteroidetes-11]